MLFISLLPIILPVINMRGQRETRFFDLKFDIYLSVIYLFGGEVRNVRVVRRR